MTLALSVAHAAPRPDRRQSLRLGWARLRSHIRRGLDTLVPGTTWTWGEFLLTLYVAWEVLSWFVGPLILLVLL